MIRFADRVAAAGMTVFLPSLFGEPGKPVSVGYAMREMALNFCVRREFNVWRAGRSSPIVDWLRALARKVHAECGGNGVGAVGMCFTGGYALAMMTEACVVAPVLSQPSMPLPLGEARKAALDCSAQEIACTKNRFEAIEIDPKNSESGPMKARSVLTINCRTALAHPRAEERVISFLKERLGA